jgi:thiol:disulfide interchange protein DsbA
MSKRATVRSTLLLSTMLLATACTAAPDAPTTAVSTTAASPEVAVAASASDAAAAPVVAASAATEVASTAAAPVASASVADAAAAAAIVAPKGVPGGAAPVEGTDYTLIDTPDQPSGDKVQVTEVFGYSCIHCSDLQPELSKWKKTLPADVQFNYLPAAFGGIWDAFARAFFAAQAMGVQEKSHDSIFRAVFVDKRVVTADDIPKLYADYGVDPKIFASTMQSFAVSAKIASAHEQAVRWGVDSTPTLIVDGKYRVQELRNGGPAGMFHTIDWLIAKQRPAHAKH